MTDNELKQQVATITDPVELLRGLVKLDDDISGVGDPYYRDLYMEYINRAKGLLILHDLFNSLPDFIQAAIRKVVTEDRNELTILHEIVTEIKYRRSSGKDGNWDKIAMDCGLNDMQAAAVEQTMEKT